MATLSVVPVPLSVMQGELDQGDALSQKYPDQFHFMVLYVPAQMSETVTLREAGKSETATEKNLHVT